MLPPFVDNEEEDNKPVAYKTLFPDTGQERLVKITETPNRMIIPMVRMSVITQAISPDRKLSLIEVFQNSFDERMISRERKGRIEAVEIMQAQNRSEEGSEVPL